MANVHSPIYNIGFPSLPIPLLLMCVSIFGIIGEKNISRDYEVATEESWQISFCSGLMAAKLQGAGSSEVASRTKTAE